MTFPTVREPALEYEVLNLDALVFPLSAKDRPLRVGAPLPSDETRVYVPRRQGRVLADSREAQIRMWCQRPQTVAQIQAATGFSWDTIMTALYRLKAKRQVRRIGSVQRCAVYQAITEG